MDGLFCQWCSPGPQISFRRCVRIADDNSGIWTCLPRVKPEPAIYLKCAQAPNFGARIFPVALPRLPWIRHVLPCLDESSRGISSVIVARKLVVFGQSRPLVLWSVMLLSERTRSCSVMLLSDRYAKKGGNQAKSTIILTSSFSILADCLVALVFCTL